MSASSEDACQTRDLSPQRARRFARHAWILRSAKSASLRMTRRSQRQRDSLPIWSCSVWGLPCPPHYCGGGALLPHLFTLTPPFWPSFAQSHPARTAKGGAPKPHVEASPERRGGIFSVALSVGLSILAEARTKPSRTLSGTLLCGVRTFLCPRRSASSDRPARLPTQLLYKRGFGPRLSGVGVLDSDARPLCRIRKPNSRRRLTRPKRPIGIRHIKQHLPATLPLFPPHHQILSSIGEDFSRNIAKAHAVSTAGIPKLARAGNVHFVRTPRDLVIPHGERLRNEFLEGLPSSQAWSIGRQHRPLFIVKRGRLLRVLRSISFQPRGVSLPKFFDFPASRLA